MDRKWVKDSQVACKRQIALTLGTAPGNPTIEMAKGTKKQYMASSGVETFPSCFRQTLNPKVVCAVPLMLIEDLQVGPEQVKCSYHRSYQM